MAEKTFSPVRVRAATQEAAIAQALQMTGAGREEIEIEVLEETEKGVTIRIAPLGTAAARQETAPAPESTPVESTPEAAIEAAAAEETVSEPVAEEPAFEEPVADEIAEEDEEEAENEEDEAGIEAEIEEPSTPAPVAEAPTVREAAPDVVEHARVLAQEMLDYMGLEAEAKPGDLPAWCLPTSHDKSERVRDVPRAFLNIEGEDVGILIGKHGQTLQSFQYLLNLSLNNTSEDEEATLDGVRAGGVHVVVDAGEYRGRRAVALERAALEAAERARRDRRSVRMEPMPGHERRLVHLALFDDKTISTSSEGREPWRRVVVTPAGVRPSSPRDDRGGRERYNERSGGNRSGGRGGFGGNRGGGYGSSGSSGGSGGGNRSYGSGAGNAGGGRRGYN